MNSLVFIGLGRTDRQTDRQTTYRGITALCGKNGPLTWESVGDLVYGYIIMQALSHDQYQVSNAVHVVNKAVAAKRAGSKCE